MAISTITNFELNTNTPLDPRLVVTFSSDLTNMDFPYAGLRTFVTSDRSTWVYGTDGVWTMEGAKSKTAGIYGGSGSIPGDVNASLGTVSNIGDSVSRRIAFSSFTPNQPTKEVSQIWNYFRRRYTDVSRFSMSYLMEQKFISNSTITQGSYIEFNGPNVSVAPTLAGNLVLGTGEKSGFTNNKRFPRLSLTAYDTTNFFVSEFDQSEIPLSMSFGSDVFSLGYNYMPLMPGIQGNPHLSLNRLFSSYALLFNGRILSFNVRAQNIDQPANSYETALFVTASFPSNVQSIVGLQGDVGAKGWDPTVPYSSSIDVPQNFVRNIEHRYEKIQMWNHSSGYTWLYDTQVEGINCYILRLDMTANSYYVSIPANFGISQIRDSQNRDLPEGTEITIKFVNEDERQPGFLYLGPNKSIDPLNNQFGPVFSSQVSDQIFGTESRIRNASRSFNERIITFTHQPNTIPHSNGVEREFGDIITFKRVDYSWVPPIYSTSNINRGWDIISMQNDYRITNRRWFKDRRENIITTGGAFYNLEGILYQFNPPVEWFFSQKQDTIVGNFGMIVLNQIYFRGDGLDSTQVKFMNTGDAPFLNSYSYPPFFQGPNYYDPTSTTNTPLHRVDTASQFDLKFSYDGTRIVHVSGNFVIRPTVGGAPRPSFRPISFPIPDNGAVAPFFFINDDRLADNATNFATRRQLRRPNIWRIGKIQDQKLYPQSDSCWTFASGSGWVKVPAGEFVVPLSNVILAIKTDGVIEIQFEAIRPYTASQDQNLQNFRFEFWIPNFSYISTTTYI